MSRYLGKHPYLEEFVAAPTTSFLPHPIKELQPGQQIPKS